MVTVLLTIFSSYREFRINTIRSKGNWEAKFISIKYSDALEIEKNSNIKETSIYYNYGISEENLSSIEEYFVRLQLFGYDTNALKNSGINILKGRMPQNSNEIIISESAILNINGGSKIGDEIELTFEGKTSNYKIVGIVENLGEGFSNLVESRYEAITFLENKNLQEDTIINLSVITHNKNKIYQTTRELEENLQLDKIKNINKITYIEAKDIEQSKINNLIEMGMDIKDINFSNTEKTDEKKVQYNKELLEILGVFEGNNTEYYSFINVAIICTTIVGIAGIAQLFTAFMITYRERLKELEKLTSIGMSETQQKIMCLKEGTIIATLRHNYRYMRWNCFILNYS